MTCETCGVPSRTTRAASGASAPTLGDLLTAPAFRATRVIPSDAPLDQPFSAVAPVEDGATPAPGTVLLAPNGVPESMPDEAVALISRTGPATPIGIPVIVIGPDADWNSVIQAVAHALAGPDLARAATARRDLRTAVLTGGSFPAIAQVATTMLGRMITIVDAFLDVVGDTVDDEGRAEMLIERIEEVRQSRTADTIEGFMADDIDGGRIIPVEGPMGATGAIIVWDDDGIDPDSALMGEVIVACAIESAREQARVDAESRLRGDLLEELATGEAMDRESIIRRARLLGADLSRGGVGMIGMLHHDDDEEREVDDRTARRFVSHVRAVLELHWPHALSDWSGGRLKILLPTPADVDSSDAVGDLARDLARRLLSATRGAVPGLAVTLALSRHAETPERLGGALDEAELALTIGERLGRAGEVVTFEETGTYKLLFQIFADRPEELSSFYESTLAPLVAYDEQYQTELVGTLATYLELDGNLAATAAKLYTHRHTVRYRLDRIAELAGLDVGRSDDREKLSLGLKAMRLLGRTVRTGPAVERTGRSRR